MAESRDDFVIAVRSAFLKKRNKQKFSLLTLILLSLTIIILGSLDFRAIKYTKTSIN
jgi:rod shape-determining protein MreC